MFLSLSVENMQDSILILDYASLNFGIYLNYMSYWPESCGSITVNGRKESRTTSWRGPPVHHKSPETIFCCRSEAQEGKDGVRRALKRKKD